MMWEKYAQAPLPVGKYQTPAAAIRQPIGSGSKQKQRVLQMAATPVRCPRLSTMGKRCGHRSGNQHQGLAPTGENIRPPTLNNSHQEILAAQVQNESILVVEKGHRALLIAQIQKQVIGRESSYY